MQKLIADVGVLSGEVLALKQLDRTVLELKEQMTNSRENQKDKAPATDDDGPSEARSHREKSPASYNHHNSNFSRWSRMEFLRFNGEDLRSWLFKIEQFFSMEKVDTEERVEVAALQLEGEAIQWHLSFMRYRQYLQPATWNEYVMAMVERFGSDFDDPMEEIKKIKQTGSVKEYQAIFERNLNRVRLSQENAINCFIGGLKRELNIAVKLTNPTTLSQVYRTARMHEVYLAATSSSTKRYTAPSNNGKPLLPTPNSGNSSYVRGFTKRALSIEEMNEKRAKGLCYFCNEKFVPGHKCNSSKQLYLLELEEIEEEPYAGEGQELEIHEERMDLVESSQGMEQMEISIHALNGSLGYRTLQVTGYHAKKALSILIDTGSSHNFIDPELVKHLGCKVQSTKPQLVAAANGNMMVDRVCTITWLLQGAEFSAEFLLLPLGSCGVVLGVQWLLTLGDIKMNFRKLTMEFWYKGRKHLLRGADNQVRVQEAEKLVKHTGDMSQLCMIQVVPMGETEEQWHAIKTEEDPVVNDGLTQLLNEYSVLFEEPTGLPPSRGVFDHRIVLQNGTEPVNKRPYRYPSVKKDIIEGLVQQMLDQGIIQPSCSPFASPVVLVEKRMDHGGYV
ncbi:PREDICTED: uncharacterized protein LOC109206457 [Nicotiana attenuata]|uniref:uncharacterized protein LOC109206457 n=1 Tax=Nicotiana attenuata TaxID=49451 RepID=UPI0009047D8B|nr:PREDICTED: uncharacterized protein LOC109206457 [Nicotiana attenuata]